MFLEEKTNKREESKMQELWRKPDFVDVNAFDSSMYPFLLRAIETNEFKSNIEEQRKSYFEKELDPKYVFTEEDMKILREKLGAHFVLESYSKEALYDILVKKEDKKHKRDLRQED